MSYTVHDKRFWVKIRAGQYQCLSEPIYYRNDLPFHCISKWRWYFQYREALYRVSNPRHYVELTQGSYDYVPPIEEKRKQLKNKLIAKKGQITALKNAIKTAEQNWNELFPIQQNEAYKNAVQKIIRLEDERFKIETEFAGC